MTYVGFEPTSPVFERAKTFHALDRAATVIGRDPTAWIEKINNLRSNSEAEQTVK
jgi:hypothetical protein